MASWSRNKVDSANINSGNQYEKGNRVPREQLNAMVNAGLYAQDFAEHLADTPDTSNINIVGTPSVELVDNIQNGVTYKKFKFSNLKGNKGRGWYYTSSSLSNSTDTQTISIYSIDNGSDIQFADYIVDKNGLVFMNHGQLASNDLLYVTYVTTIKGDKGDKGDTGQDGAGVTINGVATVIDFISEPQEQLNNLETRITALESGGTSSDSNSLYCHSIVIMRKSSSNVGCVSFNVFNSSDASLAEFTALRDEIYRQGYYGPYRNNNTSTEYSDVINLPTFGIYNQSYLIAGIGATNTIINFYCIASNGAAVTYNAKLDEATFNNSYYILENIVKLI